MAPATEPSKIAGYRIEGVLGSGGMSRVYVARQISLDRRVALKVFELAVGGAGQAALRLRREAHLLAKLDHENIVRCIDFGEAEGYFYLALELIEGESLKQRLDRVGRLSGKDAARIAHAVGIALQHAHAKGVVHRDVKPGNVLLSRDGKVKLSDFGLARTPEDAEITQPGTALGTPQYLSPEQARSPRRANAQSDVYSLGATLYHMVSGVPPYQGDTLAEVITAILFDPVPPPETIEPDLDPGLSRIIARAMAKERTLRYRSALEFNADLVRWLAGQADTTVGISWEESGAPAKEPGSRRPWILGGLAALVATIAIAAGLRAVLESDPEPAPPMHAPAASIADVTSGRISPVAAHALLLAMQDGEEKRRYESELRAEAERRVADLTRAAERAARSEVGAGRFDNAFAAFEREARSRVEGALGAGSDALPESLARIVADALGAARPRLDALLAAARARTEGAIAAELAARRREIEGMLASFRLGPAAVAIDEWKRTGPARVEELLERGLAEVLEGEAAAPDPDWVARNVATWAAAADSLAAARLARVEEAAARAATIVAAARLDPEDDSPRAELASALAERIRVALAETAAIDGVAAIERIVDERLDAFERERGELAARRRAEQEAARALVVEEALARGDVDSARRAAGGSDAGSIADPWLRTLALGTDAIDAAQRAALEEIASHEGKRLRLVASGVAVEGTVANVDRAGRRVTFSDPSIEVTIAELAVEEFERRAGAAATPLVRGLVRALGGDLEGARSAIAGADAQPWFEGLAQRLDALEASRATAAKGAADEARLMLEEYDRALSAGERGRAALLADRLLSNPAATRLDEVRRRRADLDRVRKEGKAEAERERRRAGLIESTSARVAFEEDGRVRFTYPFDAEKDLGDFTLPGSEWRIVGGRLSSLSLLDRSDLAARIDLFRNRPGITCPIPFETTGGKPIRVEFELVLPLDPRPGLFGIRVLSTCFVMRTLPGGGGQVNAWQGELDEYRDYLFDPALGETRPRKSGGGWRPYALERGNRYRCVVEGAAAEGAEWSLTIEGDAVHRFRIEKPSRGNSLELRSEMPCELDELVLVGFVAGWK